VCINSVSLTITQKPIKDIGKIYGYDIIEYRNLKGVIMMFRMRKNDSLLDIYFCGAGTLQLLEKTKTVIEKNIDDFLQRIYDDYNISNAEREEYLKYCAALEVVEKMIKAQKQLLALQNQKEKVKVRAYLKKLLSSAIAFVKGLGGFAGAIKNIIEVVSVIKELFTKLSLRAMNGSFIFI
jgi:hypothetical protein